MPMNVEELIKNFTNETGFSWGLNTVIESLKGKGLYQLQAIEGNYIIQSWGPNWCEKTQKYTEPPTSEEIKEEYIRQKTIAECIKYFNNNPA
jgi:hypothetical protein